MNLDDREAFRSLSLCAFSVLVVQNISGIRTGRLEFRFAFRMADFLLWLRFDSNPIIRDGKER